MMQIPPRSIHEGDDRDEIARIGSDGAAGGLPTPAAPTYAMVRAMEDVMAVRHEQIFTYDHTPESDAGRPLAEFARDLVDRGHAIREDVQFGKPAAQVRRRLVKLAALALATIDRIDHCATKDVP